MAISYENVGHAAKALPMYIRALDIRENALGLLHPVTMKSVNNLMEYYKVRGSLEKAALLQRRVDDARRQLAEVQKSK